MVDAAQVELTFLEREFPLWMMGPYSKAVAGISTIAVHETEPLEVTNRIIAMAISRIMGIAPSTALKKMKGLSSPEPDFGSMSWQAHFCTTKTVELICREISRPDAPSKENLEYGMLIELAARRASTTILSADAVAQNGQYHESAALVRMAMEKIAWCCFLEQGATNDPFELSPQSCIRYLKNENLAAGKLYGYLSETAHFQFESHYKSLLFGEGKNLEIAVRTHQMKCIGLLLTTSFCVIFRRLFQKFYATMYNREYFDGFDSSNYEIYIPALEGELKISTPDETLSRMLSYTDVYEADTRLSQTLIELLASYKNHS